MSTTPLTHAAYTTPVKLRGYNCRVAVHTATLPADAARILRRLNPAWQRADHQQLALAHQSQADAMGAEYNRLLDEAAMETFGRPFQFGDYRISCIACEDFSQAMKEKLRTAGYGKSRHQDIARAHAHAARYYRGQ